MKIEFHPSNERGHFNYGWLKTYHSFSFSTYFNPLRERFGSLRVINSDVISGGTGFDLHPHNNMEIITIMLEGALKHRDSMGNEQVLKAGEVQVMSAGTGIMHAEFNNSLTEEAKLFQIWIFPRAKNLKPRYDQQSFDQSNSKGQFLELVVPDTIQTNDTLYIQQDAYISIIDAQPETSYDYAVKREGNGTFVMAVKGTTKIGEFTLKEGDAVAISETTSIEISSLNAAQLLFIEIPME